MESPKNVILVTIDALRADHVSSYGYSRETTPFLDGFAARSVRFTSAFSASSHTREAIPSILTGRYPAEAVDDQFQRSADTLAEHLRGEFETAGFHSNPFVSRAYGFDQGFETFDDDLHLGSNRLLALAQRAFDKLRNRHYARANEINERSLNWLDSLEGDRPFFLWNHYMDPHGPYEAPAEYQRRFHGEAIPKRETSKLYHRAVKSPEEITETERRRLIDLYDAEIAYTDDRLATFFDALERRDLLDGTLVLITADHGDAFGEHGYYEHPRYLHDALVHVPMIVAGPGVTSGTVEAPASTLDVATTVLAAVGRPDPELPGKDLRAIAAAPDDYADRTVISQARGEKKDSHLRRFSGRGRATTLLAEYDAGTERIEVEPHTGETTEREEGEGRAEAEGEEHIEETVEDRLRAHIEEHASGDTGEEVSAADEDVSDEIQDRLSALGYR
ncbi:MAG: sulfatase [Halapricum sp.]